MLTDSQALALASTDLPARPYREWENGRTVRTHPLTVLSRIAHVIENVQESIDRGDIERDDIETYVPVVIARLLSESGRIARELHSMWHGHVVAGERSPVTPAPNHFERVRAQTRTERTRKGETVKLVSVHGRAMVIGAHDVRPNRAHSMSATRARAMLDTLPVTSTGARDALDVYRATQALYGRDVPALIGADSIAWEEWQDTGTVRTGTYRPVRHPSRYRLTTARTRASEHPLAGECIAPADVLIERENVPALIERDENGRVIVKTHGRTRTRTVPARTVWHGHRLIARGDTYRAQRAQRARALDESLLIRAGDDVAHVLASVAGAIESGETYRALWCVLDENGRESDARGSLTVSASGSYSIRTDGVQLRARTTGALARALAQHLAQ